MNRIVLGLVFVLITSVIFSQERDYNKIKALKVGYFTDQLELLPEEAQAFWPIYNAYDTERHNLREEERALMMRESSQVNNLTEENAQELLDQLIALHKKEEKAEKAYLDKLQNVLSAKKIIILLRAEEDFRRRLLRRLRKKKWG